jgi:uncharacterized iron-regulated protein
VSFVVKAPYFEHEEHKGREEVIYLHPSEWALFKRFLIMSALVAAGMLWGCGGKKMAVLPPAAPLQPAGPIGAGQILDVQAGAGILFDDLIHSLASKDVVFIGEIHDNPAHHLMQTQILQALLNRWGTSAVIGMEFFPRPAQESLDRYIKGELTESEFLAAVDWQKLWGYPYYLYRPLMLAAREKFIRILAINAPREIVKKVAREGIENLTGEERAQIARDIDLGNTAHREFVRKAFGEHSHPDLNSFDRFYEAQAVWEETMAETLSNHLLSKGGKMVVFTGNGHIVHKFGVPDRTAKRIPVSMATVVPYPVVEHDKAEGLADYIWLTPGHPRSRP